jgi:hypothetical protein
MEKFIDRVQRETTAPYHPPLIQLEWVNIKRKIMWFVASHIDRSTYYGSKLAFVPMYDYKSDMEIYPERIVPQDSKL